MENIVEKLQKLIAHEESAKAIGNIAEAAAVAGMIAKLMQKHGLDAADLELEEVTETPVASTSVNPGSRTGKARGSRSKWRETLARGVASAMFCKLMVTKGKSTLHFVGRQEQREAAVMLFNYLHDLTNRLGKSEYKKYREANVYPMSAHDYRHSFTVGFADAVYARLFNDLQTLRGNTEKGMVLVNKHEQAIQQYFSGMRIGRAQGLVRSVGGDGYKTGYARGSEANLKAKQALK